MNQRTATSRDSRSIGEITNNLLTNAQEVMRDEVRLAKTEIGNELKSAVRASAMLVAGVVLALFVFGMMLVTATAALDIILPLWAAAGIVTVVLALVAGALVALGRKRISEVDPKPNETFDSMRENVRWVKQQTQ